MRRSHYILAVASTFIFVAVAQAQVSMTPSGMARKPVDMILDADFGSSTDDLFALMMANRYVDEGRVRLLGVICDREGEKNALVADVVNTYYGHPDVPVGLERNGVKNPRVFIPYNGIVDLVDDAGRPLFRRTYDGDAFPDGYKLYRRLLSQADDRSVVVVAIGFATTLSELFDSEADEYSPLSGLDLFARKVKAVYMQAGRFQAGDNLCGYNMRAASRHSANFFNRFPREVELYFSPSYVGDNMDYPPRDVLADLSYTELNPIKAAYVYYDCDTGQRMWDTNCVAHAAEGDAGFLLSPRGFVTFVDNGEDSALLFEEDARGNARYQLLGDSYYSQTKVMDIRRMTRLAPNPAPYTIEAPQPQIVGKDAEEWARRRMTLLVDKYVGSAGNRLDPDEARELFYPLGYTGSNWKDYEDALRAVVDAIYEKMLRRATRVGNKTLVLVTGPPGAGKSFAVRSLKLERAGLVYDAELSREGQLADAIEKARAEGMEKIVVVPVYNDVMTCYLNAVNRGRAESRYTALDYLVAAFRANKGRLRELRDRFPDVEIRPVDCSGNRGATLVGLDKALTWNYSVDAAQLRELLVYLRTLVEDGDVDGASIRDVAGDVAAIPGLEGDDLTLARQIDRRVAEIAKAYLLNR